MTLSLSLIVPVYSLSFRKKLFLTAFCNSFRSFSFYFLDDCESYRCSFLERIDSGVLFVLFWKVTDGAEESSLIFRPRLEDQVSCYLRILVVPPLFSTQDSRYSSTCDHSRCFLRDSFHTFFLLLVSTLESLTGSFLLSFFSRSSPFFFSSEVFFGSPLFVGKDFLLLTF